MSVAAFLGSVEEALAPARDVVRPVLSDHRVLAAWAVLVAASVGVLWWDLRRHNEAIPSLMRGVWTLVAVYSGPAGLALYWYAGRTQIARDSLWRRGVRSTAHCYSGCGAGEVTGVVLLVGVLAIGDQLVTTLGTFAFAYTFGYALTVGPLLQEGETLATALADALYTETPSITVMEVTAIGTDVLLAGEATIGEPLFWGALAFSLSVGFVAAYPVNVALVRVGVKEGMADPTQLAEAS
ncbi:DUF4396 domain-containing protein [Halobacterium hubeiense]|uniref:DUF4396 domain-containing protein n=1 Tax=Halobacterium hubeiense TaxID=1407499 RepID=UPI003C7750BA